MAKKYSEKVNGPAGGTINEAPLWPQECSVDGCYGETMIVWITVHDPGSNRNRTTIFSDVGTCRHIGDGQKLILRGSYEFVGWVTRCAECFTAEMITMKKRQQELTTDKAFLDAYRAKLRKSMNEN